MVDVSGKLCDFAIDFLLPLLHQFGELFMSKGWVGLILTLPIALICWAMASLAGVCANRIVIWFRSALPMLTL